MAYSTVNLTPYFTPSEAIRWAILEVRESELFDVKYGPDTLYESSDREPNETDEQWEARKKATRDEQAAAKIQYEGEKKLIHEEQMNILMAALQRVENDGTLNNDSSQ